VSRRDSRRHGLPGMTLIASAVIARRHARMYHLATSAINPVNMGTKHRTHRAGPPQALQDNAEHRQLAKGEICKPSRSRSSAMSVSRFPCRRPSSPASTRGRFSAYEEAAACRAERDLIRAEKLIELYEPLYFTMSTSSNARNARLLSAALPPEERPTLRFRAGIDRLVGLLDQRAHPGHCAAGAIR